MINDASSSERKREEDLHESENTQDQDAGGGGSDIMNMNGVLGMRWDRTRMTASQSL